MDLKAAINRVLARVTGYELRRPGASQMSTWMPPGHFYSPIVDPNELHRDFHRVFNRTRPLPEINLNESSQIELIEIFRTYYPLIPFPEQKRDDALYYYENEFYSYGDAIIFFCMLYHFRPRHVVEFGSGFSSCVSLDTKRLFLPQLECVFIDPYPQRLKALLASQDAKIVEARAQDISITDLPTLVANDVIFIDSTHVSKAGSDVNHHIFELLPSLPSGVLIHFHDVFYPFEYPESWFFDENRSWNENYLLRAFLACNQNYEIVLFNTFLDFKHHDLVVDALPLFAKNPGGALWLRKLR
jgi:hypothetical protein